MIGKRKIYLYILKCRRHCIDVYADYVKIMGAVNLLYAVIPDKDKFILTTLSLTDLPPSNGAQKGGV